MKRRRAKRPLQLWKMGKVTGLWTAIRGVTEETKEQWLEIFKKDEPKEKFVVSRNRPKYPKNVLT